MTTNEKEKPFIDEVETTITLFKVPSEIIKERTKEGKKERKKSN